MLNGISVQHFSFFILVGQTPINRCFTQTDKKGIGFGEVPATEESVVGREGTWMSTGEDLMLWIGDQSGFCPCIRTPKEEDDRIFPLVQKRDDLIGKVFPAFIFVAVGRAFPYGQYCV